MFQMGFLQVGIGFCVIQYITKVRQKLKIEHQIH